MPEIIEADRHITAYLPMDEHGNSRPLQFTPGPNQIESGDWEALKSKKDAKGKPILDRYLAAGHLRRVGSFEANAIVDGEQLSRAATLPKAPLQAAAEAYAKTGDQEAALAAAERANNGDPNQPIPFKEPPAPKRK